jgi:hydroxymethylpyrimidine pyrophosphatase-like HAD family hydrolase
VLFFQHLELVVAAAVTMIIPMSVVPTAYVDGGNTYTYTACENGSYTYSINGQVVDDTPWTSESFGDGNTTWEQMKAAALAEGGTCN